MLKVLNLIVNNNNWEEILKREPYYLHIKRDIEYPNLILLKYDLYKSDPTNDIVKECRGLIIDISKNEVACHGFNRFYNYGEEAAAQIDWNDGVSVQEKIDGSLLKLWYYRDGGHWMLSSSACIQAKNAKLETGYNLEYLFLKTVQFDTLNNFAHFYGLDGCHTYSFELVSPYNQVVVPYKENKIYFLGARDLETDKEVDLDIGIERPARYQLNTLADCLSFIRENFNKGEAIEHEGFVVVDSRWNRIKIKSEEYLLKHRIGTGKVSNRSLLDLIRIGEDKEFLAYFPIYQVRTDKIKKAYQEYKDTLIDECDAARHIWNQYNEDKQKIGWLVRDGEISARVFIYINSNFNVEKVLAAQSNTQIIKNLQKYGFLDEGEV